jgi:hypothetical protein
VIDEWRSPLRVEAKHHSLPPTGLCRERHDIRKVIQT